MIKKIKRQNSGMTLIEVVVTMALTAILLSSTTSALLGCLQTFERMKNTSYAITLADTLMDKVAGEITSAIPGQEDEKKLTGIWLGTVDGTGTPAVCFRRGDSTPIYITANNGELLIHYYPIKSPNPDNSGTSNMYEATNWSYDKKVYHGFQLDSMTFNHIDSTNIIEIAIKLQRTDNTSFQYTEKRYVECTNFTGSDIQKILTGITIPQEKFSEETE